MYKLKEQYDKVSFLDSTVYEKDAEYKTDDLKNVPDYKIEEYFDEIEEEKPKRKAGKEE